MLKRMFGPGSKGNNDSSSPLPPPSSTGNSPPPPPSSSASSSISSIVNKELGMRKEGSLTNNKVVNEKFDYCYITPRIIVTGRPTTRESDHDDHRVNIQELKAFLDTKSMNNEYNYCVWNFSSKNRNTIDYTLLRNQIQEFQPLSRTDITDETPSIGQIFRILYTLKFFLAWDPATILVLHCNNGIYRTGFILAAFLVYEGIQPTMQDALTFFSTKRLLPNPTNGSGSTSSSAKGKGSTGDDEAKDSPNPSNVRSTSSVSTVPSIPDHRLSSTRSLYDTMFNSWKYLLTYMDTALKANPSLPKVYSLTYIVVTLPNDCVFLDGNTTRNDNSSPYTFPVLQLYHGSKLIYDTSIDAVPNDTIRWDDHDTNKLIIEFDEPLLLCGDYQIWFILPSSESYRTYTATNRRSSYPRPHPHGTDDNDDDEDMDSPTGQNVTLHDLGKNSSTSTIENDLGTLTTTTTTTTNSSSSRSTRKYPPPNTTKNSASKPINPKRIIARGCFYTSMYETGVATLHGNDMDIFRPTVLGLSSANYNAFALSMVLATVEPDIVAKTNLDRLLQRSFLNLRGLRALQQGANDFSSHHYVFPDPNLFKTLKKEGYDEIAIVCALQRANNTMGRCREVLDCPSFKEIFKDNAALRDLKLLRETLTMDEIAAVLAARGNITVKKRGVQIGDLDFSGLLEAAKLGNIFIDPNNPNNPALSSNPNGNGGMYSSTNSNAGVNGGTMGGMNGGIGLGTGTGDGNGNGGGGGGGKGKGKKKGKRKGKGRHGDNDDDSSYTGSSRDSFETDDGDGANDTANDDSNGKVGTGGNLNKLFANDAGAVDNPQDAANEQDNNEENENDEGNDEEGSEDWTMKDHPIFGKWFTALAEGKAKSDIVNDLTKDQWNPALLDVDPNATIPPDLPATTVPLKSWLLYDKFAKMTKVGLPRPIVEHAMTKEFFNPGLLDASPDDTPLAIDITPPRKKKNKQPSIIRKKLHWVPIRGKIENTVWSSPPADVIAAASQLILNEKEFQYLFVMRPEDMKKKKKNKNDTGGLIQLVDHKRAMNAGIALAKLRIPIPAVVECLETMSVRTGNHQYVLSGVEIQNLVSLAPTDEEIKLVKGFKGDTKRLGPAEQFFLAVANIPYCKQRAQGLFYQFNFDERINESRGRIKLFAAAMEQIRNAKRFQRLLKAVLVLGNKMNGVDNTNRKGLVKAYTLVSLQQLQVTKTFGDVPISVLQYFIKLLRHVDPDLLRLSEDFSGNTLSEAKRLPLDILQSDMKELREGLTEVETMLKELIQHQGGNMASMMNDNDGGGGEGNRGPIYINEEIELAKEEQEEDDEEGEEEDATNGDSNDQGSPRNEEKQDADTTNKASTSDGNTTNENTATNPSGTDNATSNHRSRNRNRKSSKKKKIIRRRVESLPYFTSLAQTELGLLTNEFQQVTKDYTNLLQWFKEDNEITADELFGNIHLFVQTFDIQVRLYEEKKRKEKEAKRKAKEKLRKEQEKNDNGGSDGDDDDDDDDDDDETSSSEDASSTDEESTSSDDDDNIDGTRKSATWMNTTDNGNNGGDDDDDDDDNHGSGSSSNGPMGGILSAIKARGNTEDKQNSGSINAKAVSSPPVSTSSKSSSAQSEKSNPAVVDSDSSSNTGDPRGGLLAAIRAKAVVQESTPPSSTSSTNSKSGNSGTNVSQTVPTTVPQKNGSTDKGDNDSDDDKGSGGGDPRNALLAAIAARRKQ